MRLAFEAVSYSYAGGDAAKKRGRKKQRERQADWGNAPDALWALHDVSLTVEPGEFTPAAGSPRSSST